MAWVFGPPLGGLLLTVSGFTQAFLLVAAILLAASVLVVADGVPDVRPIAEPRQRWSRQLSRAARSPIPRSRAAASVALSAGAVVLLPAANSMSEMEPGETQVDANEWRRVGSNHRQHDYESCALPLSYAARSRPQRVGLAFSFALSLRFLARCLASATRFRLFRTAKPLVCFRTGTAGRPSASAWGQGGCGGRIRTDDLRVMSPTSCRCSTPLAKYTRRRAAAAGAEAKAEGRGRSRAAGCPTFGGYRPLGQSRGAPRVIQSQAWRTALVWPSAPPGPEAPAA
jgi:hypothetical protein